MSKRYQHFDVTKNGEKYHIVVEGTVEDAKEELKKTFGFDEIKFVNTSSARWQDMHGNKKIGRCTVRAFWIKNRWKYRDGRA